MNDGERRRHLVVGTAGHIDHGKSALVEALTGIDPDRLAEEKRRGITIELGFADWRPDAAHVVSFVDVPGHERFVRHMVAGASGIDAVLLVVAADQGVQPQTREHVQICSLLRVPRGIIALSKVDLADDELRQVVALELGELVRGTFLAAAPVVPLSARTGEGLDALRAELLALFAVTRPRDASGIARLPVDRSFVLRGFGTVVTGTLVSGRLREGEELEVLPGGARGRVRGLQVHGQALRLAEAGQRTAVNLQGLDTTEVPRGSTLVAPGSLLEVRRLWVRLELLPHAARALARGGPIRFHHGTAERAGRLRVLGRSDDGSLRAEIWLAEAAPLAPGDRFILRRPKPVDTVGGGIVVDVQPPRPREAREADFAPAVDLDDAVLGRLARAGRRGRGAAGVATELGQSRERVEEALDGLGRAGRAVRGGTRWLDAAVWRALRERAVETLARFHGDEPLQEGMSRERLRAALAPEMAQEAWRELLESLAREGEIDLRAERVARAGHSVVLEGKERELAERIEQAYRAAGLAPPGLEELLGTGEAARAAPIVDWLLVRSRLVRLHDGSLFHAGALAELRDKLRRHAERSRRIDVAAFKELAGVTRKHAIPLLEHLDATRVTRRVGNEREILLD